MTQRRGELEQRTATGKVRKQSPTGQQSCWKLIEVDRSCRKCNTHSEGPPRHLTGRTSAEKDKTHSTSQGTQAETLHRALSHPWPHVIPGPRPQGRLRVGHWQSQEAPQVLVLGLVLLEAWVCHQAQPDPWLLTREATRRGLENPNQRPQDTTGNQQFPAA